MNEPITLASASPRRRELLEAAGWQVTVMPAQVDETPRPAEAPDTYVLRLARAKAAAVSATGIVLGADTTVVVDGAMLGKPADAQDARRMLCTLSGREHAVLTGVALRYGSHERSAVASARVWFDRLSDGDIAAYVASGEPFDKAGGYAIQGRAARFIPRIEGSYSNVVGLPLQLVWRLWQELEAVKS